MIKAPFLFLMGRQEPPCLPAATQHSEKLQDFLQQVGAQDF